jgi:phosphotriesterase-related protein
MGSDMPKFSSHDLTRRQVLEALGIGAAAAAIPGSLFADGPTFPKGAIIRTLFKDYAPEDLGTGPILFHEHMQLGVDFNQKFAAAGAQTRALNGQPAAPGRGGAGGGGAARGGAPGGGAARGGGPPGGRGNGGTPPPDIMRNSDLMAAEVAKTKDAGIACIVDAGHEDSGRDINFLREVAMKSGVPIVAGGGLYSQPWYPKEISTMTEEQIVKALIKQADDNTLGAFGEIGSWDEMTADERKVFRAVGKAHVATNLPIFTHTGIPGKAAIEQLDILEDAGVKPESIVIGHLGNLVDANVYVHKVICRRGAFVGFDRQGGGGDAQVVPMVMALIDAGFVDHLMFSADASSGYSKTITVFVPKLKAAGVSDEALHKITVDNPRRFLAFVPKRPRKKQA